MLEKLDTEGTKAEDNNCLEAHMLVKVEEADENYVQKKIWLRLELVMRI